jgi:hypothetical protein
MAGVEEQGVRSILQPGQPVVHVPERGAAVGPHVDLHGSAGKDRFELPGGDVREGEPGVVRLPLGARLADDEDAQGVLASHVREAALQPGERLGCRDLGRALHAVDAGAKLRGQDAR